MPGTAKQTSKAKPNNTANATKPDEVPITQEEFDKIINTSKGDRPENVLKYLPEEYVKAHEALFEQQGGSFIIVEKWVVQSRYDFFSKRKFVGLSSEMEQVVAEYKAAGNDWRILNKRLALGEDDLSDTYIYLIRIKPGDPRFSYKMPNGREAGANGQWIAGGFTKGGTREAALEGSEVIKTDRTVETILKQFENWEQLQ